MGDSCDKARRSPESDGGGSFEQLEDREAHARQRGQNDFGLLQQAYADVGAGEQRFDVLLRDVLEELEHDG